jgi:hypothetical protein
MRGAEVMLMVATALVVAAVVGMFAGPLIS